VKKKKREGKVLSKRGEGKRGNTLLRKRWKKKERGKPRPNGEHIMERSWGERRRKGALSHNFRQKDKNEERKKFLPLRRDSGKKEKQKGAGAREEGLRLQEKGDLSITGKESSAISPVTLYSKKASSLRRSLTQGKERGEGKKKVPYYGGRRVGRGDHGKKKNTGTRRNTG